MVGILIVAHSIYGEALLRSVSHVLGQPPARVLALGMTVRDDPDAMLERAREALARLDDGHGVLVLTDILGATPSNIATRLVRPGSVELVAGVSLPMLVRALTYRNEPLATVVRKALSGGIEGVVQVEGGAQDAAPKAGGAQDAAPKAGGAQDAAPKAGGAQDAAGRS